MSTRLERSLLMRVVEAVKTRGTATIDDITVDINDVTRKQINDALANARDRRLLRQKVQGSFKAKRCAIWEVGTDPKPTKRQPAPVVPLASVWELGTCPERKGPWPPLPAGREFNLLGDWG